MKKFQMMFSILICCLVVSNVLARGEMKGKWMYIDSVKQDNILSMFFIDTERIEMKDSETLLYWVQMKTPTSITLHQMQIFIFEDKWVAKILNGLEMNIFSKVIKEIPKNSEMWVVEKNTIVGVCTEEVLKLIKK
jgi:hypothetical protein